ncbi:hypothetical protein PHYBLDRAFT_75465 [Phycomyces blakesleeanus NRRL 1555(-)]|uniref:DUF4112 domain-containing protein n=2 Tax=Phycomyces blakesleeanus TaxID=4837 RepID=A0A167Q871_PHYB8|nr:hypothetical protein PHYBLDRAFT_75465 [Phycomyces blakesleeanus NRRL 1555(-)]OAD79254.1 hypothetical protein PHYBLDRAFT_75465 [Phycomyces blakesleeanus NRRL 1555(-)]|eukprot:XP_018297294.1 hypothetical protein PHYBLDRAFT_75465 [Phycomyces blakesleeanus NRRL 1555(-)]
MYKPNVKYSPVLSTTPLLYSHNTIYDPALGSPRIKNDGWNTLDPDSPLKLSDQHILRQVQQQAWWLDRDYRFCGLAVGLDGIIGLVPVIGDLVGAVFSLHLIWMACQIRLPRYIIFQMLLNVLADFLIGLVPVVGDILDTMFRCNIRNAQMLEKHLLNSNALRQPEQGMVENERSSTPARLSASASASPSPSPSPSALLLLYKDPSNISSDVIKSHPTDKPPCVPVRARATHMTNHLLTPTPSVCQEHDTFESMSGSPLLDQPQTPPSEMNIQMNGTHCIHHNDNCDGPNGSNSDSVDAALVDLLKVTKNNNHNNHKNNDSSDGNTLGDTVQSDIADSPQSASRTAPTTETTETEPAIKSDSADDEAESDAHTKDKKDKSEEDKPKLNPLVHKPNKFVGKRQAFSFSVGCQDTLVECSPFNKFVTAKQKKRIIQKSGNPTDLLVALYNPITPLEQNDALQPLTGNSQSNNPNISSNSSSSGQEDDYNGLSVSTIVDPTKINLQDRIILRRESKRHFRKPLRRSAKC